MNAQLNSTGPPTSAAAAEQRPHQAAGLDEARLVVGLSGGVDSAVTLLTLQRQGYDVRALFMKNWEEDDTEEYCAAANDLADAERVCEALGVPLETVNFSYEYWQDVFSHFLSEHAIGRTPNPDVLCNREVKFKAFLDFAMDRGATHIATGHYARIGREADGALTLERAVDEGKDQSYFLALLGQAQLQRSLFPLGELHKDDVRKLAREAALPVHDKRDSTGLCFIGERPFRHFLERFMPPSPGPIRCVDDQREIGEHAGLMYYTIGQRQGLGIGGDRAGTGAPWYVARKSLDSNTLWVVQGHEHPALFSRVLAATEASWVRGSAPFASGSDAFECTAKIRYRQRDQACTVRDAGGGRLDVSFEVPQRAVTPGQMVVFYRDRACLGAAVIDQSH